MGDWKRRCMALPVALLGLVGVLFALTGTVWCKTFRILRVYPTNEPPSNLPSLEFGLFTTSNYLNLEEDTGIGSYGDSCIEYPDGTETDIKWRSAVILQVIAWAVSITLSLVLFLTTCCDRSVHLFRATGAGFIIISTLFTGLIFLVWGSKLCGKGNPVFVEYDVQAYYEDSCELGPSAPLVIVGICLYFIVGLMCCCLGPASPAAAAAANTKKDEPEKEQVQSNETPDEETGEAQQQTQEETEATAEEETTEKAEEEPAATEDEPKDEEAPTEEEARPDGEKESPGDGEDKGEAASANEPATEEGVEVSHADAKASLHASM